MNKGKISASMMCSNLVDLKKTIEIFEKEKIENKLPDIIKPQDFKDLKNINLVYKGKLKDYNKNKVAKYEVAY